MNIQYPTRNIQYPTGRYVENLNIQYPTRNIQCPTGRYFRIGRFSLVELLVVMAIIAILLGVGLPAFQSLARGQGTTLAARNLSAKLKATRSYAITARKKVAVLFPKGGTIGTTQLLNSKYPFSSYRTCIVTGDASPYTFDSWIDGESWDFLPSGTVIYDLDITPGIGGGILNTVEVDGVDVTDIATGTKNDIPAIVFKPSGTTEVSQYMSITDGQVTNGSITRTNPNDPGVNLSISKFTGRISFNED